MDAETQTNYKEGELYLQIIQHPGWELIKEQVINPAILDLQSVNNINLSTVTDIAREVYARKMAVTYLVDILKDVEGRAIQHKNNNYSQDKLVII